MTGPVKHVTRLTALLIAVLICSILGGSGSSSARDRKPPEDKVHTTEPSGLEAKGADRAGSRPTSSRAGSRLRQEARHGTELRPAPTAKRSKAYERVLTAAKRKYNDPESLWDQAYLNSNQPEARRLRDALDRYEQGRLGASVKDFDLHNKSAQEIDAEAVQRGFTKKQTPLGIGNGESGEFFRKDGTKTTNADDPTLARQIFYENKDGGMIRVKPDGDYNKDAPRRPPYASKSVKYDENGGTEWSNEAFKITNDGTAIPKSPADFNVEIKKSVRYIKDNLDALADLEHPYLRK